MVEIFFDFPLTAILFTGASLGNPWKTVLLTVITFMFEDSIGIARESGYELSKAGDDAVTSQDDVLHKGRPATAWMDDDRRRTLIIPECPLLRGASPRF
jgi:hypothetical protein